MDRRQLLPPGVAFLGGCSLLPAQKDQQRRDWPLTPHRPTTQQPPRSGRTLLIRAMSAGPGMDVRRVQWLLKDGNLNTDYYDQWPVPPVQAMEEGMRRWVSDADLFAAVVAPGSSVIPDFTLETELTALLADPQAGTGVLEQAETAIAAAPHR